MSRYRHSCMAFCPVVVNSTIAPCRVIEEIGPFSEVGEAFPVLRLQSGCCGFVDGGSQGTAAARGNASYGMFETGIEVVDG